MRIVHVSVAYMPAVFRADRGGAIQRRIAETAREQVRRGHEVTVYSPGPARETREIDGVIVHYLPCRTSWPVRHIEFVTRAMAHVRRGFDVIHGHSEPELGPLARAARVPAVMQYDNFLFRGGPESRLAPAMRRVLTSWDRLLPCSDYCAEESMRAWRLPAERVTVVPNGVNTEQFSPAAGRDGAGGPDGLREDGQARTLLYVGRVGRQKGTDVLLDALGLIRRDHPATELVIAGPIGQFDRADFADAESEEAWRRRFDAAGVRYLGPVDDADLAPLMASADVFVMPTRQLEMFGMAAVEAAACGTPVVASDHGGLRETVPREVGGRFRNDDPADLAATVSGLLSGDRDLDAVGRMARDRAKRYSWPAVVDRLEEIYSEVIGGRGVGGRDPQRVRSTN